MITGTVELDLRRDSEARDREMAGWLYGVPEGTRVILYVGDRHFVNPGVVPLIAQYVTHVHLDVHGSARAVEAWTKALRGEGYAGLPSYSQVSRW